MPDPTVPSDVLTLADEFADAKPMRRGSLSERYVKCSKPSCRCGESEDARHGPYYSVSRVVNGKTQSRWLNAEEAKIVRRQVEQGQEFRKNIEAYWEACERWADAELETLEAASAEAAKKGASKQRLKRKSSGKSRSS
jgi:hypothetical protein